MAAILPTDILPNYSSDGTNITIPLTDLAGLATAEANATTGDGRKVAFELVKTIHENLQALADEDKPAQFLTSESTPTGQGPSEVRKSYTFTFDVNISAVDVADEPA
jgi:hypothetical protein